MAQNVTQYCHVCKSQTTSGPPVVEAVSAMQKCISDVRSWMREDQLMLNDDKTEFLIIGTRRQLSKISTVASARNLGTWFDTHLDMGTHITKICIIYVILGNIYPEN